MIDDGLMLKLMGLGGNDWILNEIGEESFLGIRFEHEVDDIECFIEQFIVCLCMKFGILECDYWGFLGEIWL